MEATIIRMWKRRNWKWKPICLLLPPSQIISHFSFSRFIDFIMHLHTYYYVWVHRKSYESRKVKFWNGESILNISKQIIDYTNMHEQLFFCSTPTGFFLPSLILLGIGVPLYCLLPKNKTKKMLRANATALICVEWHVAMHSLYQLWIISVAGACKQNSLGVFSSVKRV